MRHDYAAANAEWATKEAQYISDLRQSKKALETNGLRLQSVEKQLARHVSDSERRAVGLTSDLAAAQEEAAALRARNANQEEGPWMWVAVRPGWMWVAEWPGWMWVAGWLEDWLCILLFVSFYFANLFLLRLIRLGCFFDSTEIAKLKVEVESAGRKAAMDKRMGAADIEQARTQVATPDDWSCDVLFCFWFFLSLPC